MTDGRIVRIAELGIDKEHLEAYLDRLREEAEASVRLEPGFLMLHAVQLRGAPTLVRTLEVYESQAAFDAHVRSDRFTRYKDRPAVRSLRILDTIPVALASKVTPAE